MGVIGDNDEERRRSMTESEDMEMTYDLKVKKI